MDFNSSLNRQLPTKKLQAKKLKREGVDNASYQMPASAPLYYEQSMQSPPTSDTIYPNLLYDSSNPTPNPPVNTFDPNMQYGGSNQPPNRNRPTGAEFLVNPLVNAAAMTYGQQIVGTGKEYVDKEIEKYVPVSKLKYYFAVDTTYVYKKLGLIFFPFAHKDWSVKYASNEPVQPRYEVNAPDLYIPTMAYLTYVLVAGLALGTQNRFTPEVLGIQASSALACTIVEILVHVLSLYMMSIPTSLTTIDILAFAGYKFVGIIFAVLISLVFYKFGYYASLIYFSISLSCFLIRTLKVKILPVNTATPGDPYSMQNQHVVGDKRRLYLLLFIAGVQPFLMWWMSYHLIPSSNSQAPS